MSFKSLLILPALMITITSSQCLNANETIPEDLRKELADAKQCLKDATERLRRVEEKISDLRSEKRSSELNSAEFAWRVLGIRVSEIESDAIQHANDIIGTKYRGAMKVTAVRSGGPAESESIRVGDLLLGVDGLQTTSDEDIRGLAGRESTLLANKRVKFYILRNSQTLFGHFDLSNQ